MDKGLEVSQLMSGDCSASLREMAEISIVAWGRKTTAGEIDARTKALTEEIAALNPSDRGVFVARKAGVVVGFAKTYREEENHRDWMLWHLVVHPNHQRQGVGRALVNRIIAFARERGGRALQSQTHFDNQRAIRFFEDIGFSNQGQVIAPDGDLLVCFELHV